MTFAEVHNQSINSAFETFHAANPHIYRRFKTLALKLIASDKKRCSAKSILCALRFEEDAETNTMFEYKINDAFTSRYARLFIAEYPANADFFQTRRIRST